MSYCVGRSPARRFATGGRGPKDGSAGGKYAQETQNQQAKICTDVRQRRTKNTPEKPGDDRAGRNQVIGRSVYTRARKTRTHANARQNLRQSPSTPFRGGGGHKIKTGGKMACYSPLKGFEDKENGGILFKRSKSAGAAMDVACGQCIGCRIDKSQEWAARCVHESQMHQQNSFVTLTYDDEHLPHDGSLNKKHFQLFMKKLRKHFEGQKIRYFHCGEYGEKLGRPHYHACLFGIDFSDRVPFSTTNDVITYTSDTLTKIWGKGFTTCGELNYDTAAYTARYIMKKVTGARAKDHYERITEYGEVIQLEPEYTTMSLGRKKGEGLGGSFFKKYESDFFPADECPVPGRGVYKSVPRYYEDLYKEKNPDTFREIKKRRKLFRDTHADEYTGPRLEAKYTVKKAQLSQLRRS